MNILDRFPLGMQMILLSFLIMGIVSGCTPQFSPDTLSGGEPSATTVAQTSSPSPIPTASIDDGSDGTTVRLMAVIEPTESLELSLGSAGRIKEILVESGDRVEAGQLLLTLDSTDLELAREMAQLEIDAQTAAMEESILTHEQQLAQAEVNLQLRELELQRFLLSATPTAEEMTEDDDEPSSQADPSGDSYTVTLDILESQVDIARLERDRLQESPATAGDQGDTSPTEAMIRLEQARLALHELEVQFGELEIRAPWDGIIADVRARPGDMVSAGEVLIVTVVPNRFFARTTTLSEWDLPRIAVGQPVLVNVLALPEQAFRGTVGWIAIRPEDDLGTSSYPVLITLERDQPTSDLHWGMTAEVVIQTLCGGEGQNACEDAAEQE